MSNRNRITVYPLDAWARRMASAHDVEGNPIPVYWFDPQFWPHIPAGFEHVGYVERGEREGYDRGALLRSNASGLYVLYTGRSVQSLPQHKVTAALAAM